MGKVESIIKSEILRLTKRELRAAFLPLKREVRGIRLRLSRLSKNLQTHRSIGPGADPSG